MSADALMKAVAGRHPVRPESSKCAERQFLDTADWRLFTAGWVLEATPSAGSSGSAGSVEMTLRDRESEAVAATAQLPSTPLFATDLPRSSAWTDVATAIDDRRLLCRVIVTTRSRTARVVDGRGKTTVKAVIDHHSLTDAGGRVHRLPRRLSLLALRGFDRAAGRIAAELQGAGLVPEDEPVLVTALHRLGLQAPGPPAGPAVDLTPAMPAGAAMAAILARQREQLLANEDGTRRQLDDEFLHDFRVALRRARSLIKEVREALPTGEADALARELKWLGEVTGPPRDLDVHLAQVGAEPAPADDHLAPLRAHLRSRRRLAQQDLVTALDSPRYHDLLKAWRCLEETAAASGSARGSVVAGSVSRVAGRRIEKGYGAILRQGREIGPTTGPEALHDLRKRGKELRYLLECFAGLYEGDAVAAAVRELKALQDNLGEFQDCQVQAAALRSMADELVEARSAPAATLMAMGRLAEDLERRERRARAEFASRFARFSSRASRRRFETLLRSAGRAT